MRGGATGVAFGTGGEVGETARPGVDCSTVAALLQGETGKDRGRTSAELRG